LERASHRNDGAQAPEEGPTCGPGVSLGSTWVSLSSSSSSLAGGAGEGSGPSVNANARVSALRKDAMNIWLFSSCPTGGCPSTGAPACLVRTRTSAKSRRARSDEAEGRTALRKRRKSSMLQVVWMRQASVVHMRGTFCPLKTLGGMKNRVFFAGFMAGAWHIYSLTADQLSSICSGVPVSTAGQNVGKKGRYWSQAVSTMRNAVMTFLSREGFATIIRRDSPYPNTADLTYCYDKVTVLSVNGPQHLELTLLDVATVLSAVSQISVDYILTSANCWWFARTVGLTLELLASKIPLPSVSDAEAADATTSAAAASAAATAAIAADLTSNAPAPTNTPVRTPPAPQPPLRLRKWRKISCAGPSSR
jgi:hypothetical protein